MSIRPHKRKNGEIIDGKWVWDFYPKGAKGKRIRSILPEHIKTKEQAAIYAYEQLQILNVESREDVKFYSTLENLFKEATTHLTQFEDRNKKQEILAALSALYGYFSKNNYSTLHCLATSPTIIEYYTQYRSRLVSNQRVNKELFIFKKMHNYWVEKGYCQPLDFDITKFYLRAGNSKTRFSEKFFEKLIEKYPLEFIGEDYTFIEKPIPLNNLIPDALFTTKEGDYVVVEIQKERLDRTHCYKILEYRDKLEEYLKGKNISADIRMINVVIGDEVPADRQKFLNKYGIRLMLLPLDKVERIILSILQVDSGIDK